MTSAPSSGPVPHSASAFIPAARDQDAGGALPVSGGVELFPVHFTAYQHHEDLDTDLHVRAIADLLVPYGVRVTPWTVPAEDRDLQAVSNRLVPWKRPAAHQAGDTVLYWVGHGSADLLAHHCAPAPIDEGVAPSEIARAIGSRQVHPDTANSWAIVVIDACFSESFAASVHVELLTRHQGAKRYLLLSTAAKGYAELGAFTRALDRALNVTFRGRPAIGLATLGIELGAELGGYRCDTADDHRDRLVRVVPDAAATTSAPLDQLDEIQAVIDRLPADEQRHFLPKASGAELGELAWYFHGRTLQRDQILHWLATATSGALVVTGPAGAGKSALLGHILLHTRTHLRDVLVRHGHLQPLPAGTPCPDEPFDLVAHLTGVTLSRTLQLIAEAAGLPDLAEEAADGRPTVDLPGRLLDRLKDRREPLTMLFDALDEADQPLTIADQLLRPLAALPTVRVIVGTRRSTHEGPDQPSPADANILDALHPRPTAPDGSGTPIPQYVEVSQDREALAGYLRAKLHAAQQRGTLNTEDTHIANAVRRLVADHPHTGAEPQQFLYARLAAHELLNDPALLADPTPLIGQTHRRLFTRALQRLHRTDPHYTPLLQALGLTQGRGLPDQDNLWARTADALTTTPTGLGTGAGIRDLLRDAAPYLALDHEQGQTVYRLAHRTFAEHFTTAPDTPQAHAAITTTLIRHTRQTLRGTHAHPEATPPPPEDVNPYIRHHLATHARLGHPAGALQTLADHPDVLDTLDLSSITTNALHHGLAPNVLPAAIAGTVLLQHHARDTTPHGRPGTDRGWRRWWRRLGTTYLQGTPPPAVPHQHLLPGSPWPPALIAGAVQPHRLHLQLIGHTAAVWAVAVFAAPDGTPRLATVSDDKTVRIWDPATGTQVGRPLTGHTDRVRAVAAFTTPDGSPRLASAGRDDTLRVWDPATGAQVGPPFTGRTELLTAVAAFTAPDGTPRIVTGGWDGTVRIWDPATGAQVEPPLTGHTASVTAVVTFTGPGPEASPRLATASDDMTVRIWDPQTGTQVGNPLVGHTDWVQSVVVFTAPDGAVRLATASDDRTVRIWDPQTGTQVRDPLIGHTDSVWAVVAFTAPDRTTRLATSSDDKTVRIWDPATGAQEGRPLVGHTNWVQSVAVFAAPDGTPRLASAGHDDTVRIWEPVPGTPVSGSPVEHVNSPRLLGTFAAPDGTSRVAIAEDDGTVVLWEPETGRQEGPPLSGHTDGVRAVAVFTDPDGTPRIASAGLDNAVQIWDPATGLQVGPPLVGHTRRVRAVAAFSAPDGAPRLVTGGEDGTVRVWDPVTGVQQGPALADYTGGAMVVTAVAAFTARDGTPRLASGGDDGTVRIWNPTTEAQEGQALLGHTDEVTAVAAFTARDGALRLASGGRDGTVRIWNPATGTQEGPALLGHTGRVTAVAAFTDPDGSPRLVSVGDDETVRVWDPATGTQVGPPLIGHTAGVRAVSVFTAPDGTVRLVTASDDMTVRVWDPRTGTGHALPLADPALALTEHRGLLVTGTSSGHLALDVRFLPPTV
ncbi:WD40 repeat domain-containing protein [Streptomyces sp. NPDC048606]|uniref:WD40 repeat domain-containing protein n=1 Tax=Streptomyces sp. NPDC048606 TaxID=3154726 RepID=UPI0034198078